MCLRSTYFCEKRTIDGSATIMDFGYQQCRSLEAFSGLKYKGRKEIALTLRLKYKPKSYGNEPSSSLGSSRRF
jgi:hypothetical protein